MGRAEAIQAQGRAAAVERQKDNMAVALPMGLKEPRLGSQTALANHLLQRK